MREALIEIATNTAQAIGTEFLAALVRSMREAMEAKLVFITVGVGEPPRRARSVASWQEGTQREPFEYDLEGTPCRLVYEGETLVISEGLYKRFEKEKGFEGYIGVPLRGNYGKIIGHFAVLSEKPLEKPERGAAIVKLFALRAEAELMRLEHERDRETLIASLARANRRLSNRHEALRQSNESKTMLLGMAAHDLRNPLAVILNRSELIQSLIEREDGRAGALTKARESCDIIVSTTERMERLITSTLSQLSRAESVSQRARIAGLARNQCQRRWARPDGRRLRTRFSPVPAPFGKAHGGRILDRPGAGNRQNHCGSPWRNGHRDEPRQGQGCRFHPVASAET